MPFDISQGQLRCIAIGLRSCPTLGVLLEAASPRGRRNPFRRTVG